MPEAEVVTATGTGNEAATPMLKINIVEQIEVRYTNCSFIASTSNL